MEKALNFLEIFKFIGYSEKQNSSIPISICNKEDSHALINRPPRHRCEKNQG